MIIKRNLQEKLDKSLFKGKVVVLYGARQVGKTTLLKEIQKKYSDSLYFNCDEPDIRESLTNKTSTELKAMFGDKKLVILDEAQRVENIGLTLKLLVDNFKDIQVIASGSSSFDLSNKIVEPLTGRKNEFFLYPLSVGELKQTYSSLEIQRLLEQRIIYGMYPEVVFSAEDERLTKLKELARSYAYKDILQYEGIHNPEILEKLLQALALQIGNEVSYNELGRMLGINRITVGKYVDILKKAFIIFDLRPFSNNPRKELAKLRKIYFYDTGIRNALINNFNPVNLRNDIGQMWENFWISEKIKNNNENNIDVKNYFWRSYSKQEIDYVEEASENISGFECKWSNEKVNKKMPSEWLELYPKAGYQVVTPERFIQSL